MKKILLIMVVVLIGVNAFGDIIYEDGQEYTVDFTVDLFSEGYVYVRNNTVINIVDGADLFLSLGGSAIDSSVAFIKGGNVRNISSGGKSTVFISGGSLLSPGDYYFWDQSVIHIKGGLFSSDKPDEGLFPADTNLLDNSIIKFYGTDFSYRTETFYGTEYMFISGILESGDVLDNFRLNVGPDATVQFVPEPATLAMLALGGMFIRRRRAA